jgi:hypothetical protein
MAAFVFTYSQTISHDFLMAAVWNSLEIAKLAASVLTPIAIAGLGIYVHRVTKRFEDSQWRSQKLIEKRIAIYDNLAPLFNDLLCYFTYVGSWKELRPTDVISLKRKLDRQIYLAAPLFTVSFFLACQNFQNLCFQTYGAWGMDARLRTQWGRRKEFQLEWNDDWKQYYCDSKDVTDPRQIQIAYKRIMNEFATNFGVSSDAEAITIGIAPQNIH